MLSKQTLQADKPWVVLRFAFKHKRKYRDMSKNILDFNAIVWKPFQGHDRMWMWLDVLDLQAMEQRKFFIEQIFFKHYFKK